MNRLIEQTIRFIGFCLFFAGIGIFIATLIWQVFTYLRHGFWMPVSIFELAYEVSPKLGDELYPSNWKGLQELLSIPNGGILSLLFFSGLGLAMMNVEEL